MKRIVILGSTGSIGVNALEVIKRHPGRFKVVGLAANENFDRLARQARCHKVKEVAIYNSRNFKALNARVPNGVRVHAGLEGICHLARKKDADIIVAAVGGTVSIVPIIEALKAGKDIALASKEAMVSAGSLIMRLAREKNARIIPIDSEHSAVFQCLNGEDRKDMRKIYLTGTGGPLLKIKKSRFDRLPISRVIKHPKWKMGRKITVDSATMMNKGLEIIEAKWLFSVTPDKIEVVIHPEAVIHSMVEFVDGTIKANMCYPDMRFPIAYALSYPGRICARMPSIDFFKLKNMTFLRPDRLKFPALNLAYHAGKSESASCVLNAANEEVVSAYLSGDIKFKRIMDIVEKVLRMHRRLERLDLDNILVLDAWAKETVRQFI